MGRKRDRSVLTFLNGPQLHHIVSYHNTPFEEQADAIAYAVGANKCCVYVDNTGMGVAMVDLLRSRGARVVPVDISGSRLTIRPSGGLSVGHEALFSIVRDFIHGGEFSIAPTCPHVTTLRDELKQLVGTYTSQGKLHAEARTGHDDFAFSFALAVLNFIIGKAYADGKG